MVYKELKKLAARKAAAMDAETLFTSKAYRRNADSMARAVMARCFREAGKEDPPGIKITVAHEEGSEVTAYTDAERSVFINTGNPVLGGINDLGRKYECSLGMLLHELSHILFLDGKGWAKHLSEAEGGAYPDISMGDQALEEAYADMKEAAGGDARVARVLSEDFKFIENAMNDGVDEHLVCRMIGGYFTGCLQKLRAVHFSQIPSAEETVREPDGGDADPRDAGLREIHAILNQVLLYAKYGMVKIGDADNVPQGVLDDIGSARRIMDSHGYSNDTGEMVLTVCRLMALLWPRYKEILPQGQERPEPDDGEGGQEEAPGSGAGDATEGGGSCRQGGPGKGRQPSGDPFGAISAMQEQIREENRGTQPEPAVPAEGLLRGTEMKAAGNADPAAAPEEAALAAGKGSFNSAVREAAEEAAVNEAEKEEAKEKEAECLKTCGEMERDDPYYAKKIRLVRDTDCPDGFEAEYRETYGRLRGVSRACGGRIARELEERKMDAKLRGTCSGRLDRRALHRADGQCFYRNRLASEDLDLAVCVVVDESGSMSGERIQAVKRMAVIVDSFCRDLRIPCLVYGHSTKNFVSWDPVLYLYRDFDSWNARDSYRLMGISARYSNMDGHAIAYGIRRLMDRPEAAKVMLVVCDGQPHETVHMKETVLRGRKAGIRIIGAAIGDDAEQIRSLYGEGSFLSISDLDKLPQRVVGLLKAYVKY